MAYLMAVLFLIADTSLGQSYGIDEILKMAKQKTYDQQIIQKQYESTLAANRSTFGQALPKVDLSMGIDRQSTSLAGTMAQSPDFPDRFSSTSANWQIAINGSLYTFGRTGQLYTLHEQQTRLALLNKEASQETYLLTIIEAFNHSQLTLNLKELSKKTLAHAQKLLQFTQIEFESGSSSQIDLLKAKAYVARSSAEVSRSHINFQSAITKLRILLGLKEDQHLTLKPTGNHQALFFNVHQQKNAPQRKRLKIAEQQAEISQTIHNYKKLDYYPSLEIFAKVNSQSVAGNPAIPSGKLSQVAEQERWNYSIGLVLNWNLYNGGVSMYDIRQSAADAVKAKTQLEKMMREDENFLRVATVTLKASHSLLEAAKASAKAARLTFEKMDDNFKKGAVTLTALLEAEKDLSEANKSVFDANAQIISATAQLKVASGLRL